MSKKILIIGNSASAYALAKKLAVKHSVYITPATDTLKEFANCLDIRENNVPELLDFVMENSIDLTIPISRVALETDIVEIFNNNNQKIFAPDFNASKIIFDKAYAKKVLYKLRIQTPKFGIFEKQNMAQDYIKNLKYPFVIKTNSANSATLFTSPMSAKLILDECFIEKNQKVIIEDYIYGTPFSFYTITDGYKAIPIGSSITYKYALEGDGGQLTTGMGSCSPNYKLSLEQEYYIMDNIIYPTLDFLEIEGCPYLGILGINAILTDEGRIFVLGWNSFMQDCDSASILDIFDDNLYNLFDSCVLGTFSDEIDSIVLKDKFSASLVLTCKNRQNRENVIEGIDNLGDDTLLTFYPNVIKNRYLEYQANYGQVLMLTTSAPTLSKAVEKVYNEAHEINFNSMSYRKDIGLPKILS